MKETQQAILRTVVYFDIFDYPLTLLEIWRWLYSADNAAGLHNNCRYLADMEEVLRQLSDKIESKNGFYFLKGRAEIIQTRLKRYSIAEKKFQKAKKIVRILRSIPFIKMIAVCNTLAYSNTDESGDIDLFIITRKNRLWLTRLLAVSLLKIMKKRPRPGNKQDAIDTNFFLSEDDLKVDYLSVPTGGADKNLPLVYWIDQLVPIYDINGTYQKFIQANNWLENYLPNSCGCELNDRRLVKTNWLSTLVSLILKLLSFEKSARKFQLMIMPRQLKLMINKDSRVMVNDTILKFHLEDKRVEYLKRFNEKVAELASY